MLRVPGEVDIDGHVVHTGAAVQVTWLGVWYEGTVIKIGPKRNLCKVRDMSTMKAVLLESKHLQFMETHVMDTRMSPGTRVAYNDGEVWQEGTVESCAAEGVALVSWRKSALSEERLTWFELACIAPVIHNEAYEEHNKDQLEAGKSGLLQNDPIEPRPRTIENMLYESGSEDEEEIMREIATSKTSLHRARKKQSRRADTEEEVSHIYEDLPHRDDGKRSTRSPLPPPPTVPLPPPPPTFYMPFPPMLPPPMPVHPYHQMYLPYDKNSYMKVSPSFMSARTQQQSLPHPRSLKQPGLSHTSIPCIRSYGKSTNGIPPHPSSNFFQNMHDGRGKKRKLSQPSRLLRAAKSKLKKSPTVASRANSEPTPYATALELMDLSPIHPPQNRKHKKSPKKTMPSVAEAKSHSGKKSHTPSPSHPPTKHTSHTPTKQHSSHPPTQPHNNITSSPSHLSPAHYHSQPQAKSAVKPKSKRVQELTQTLSPTLPPTLPPRPYESPRSATLAHNQSHSTGDSKPRGGGVGGGGGGRPPATATGGLGNTRAKQKQRQMEEDASRYAEIEYPSLQNQRQKQGAAQEVVSTSTSHVTVPHGGSTLLTCLPGNPQIMHYEWFRDGKALSDEDPFFKQPAPGMLQIQRASLFLTGEYKCVASNNQNSYERVFHLEVSSASTGQDGSAGTSQPHFMSEITHEHLTTEAQQGVNMLASNAVPHGPNPPHRELPIIVVERPQSEPTSPTQLQSPVSPPPSYGTDTPDIRYKDEGVAEGESDSAEKQTGEITEARKTTKRSHRRVSAVLRNDMEQYLDGYGENYGALSSKTNLELEPWLEDFVEGEREEDGNRRSGKGKKMKKKRKKKSGSQGSSSQSKSTDTSQKPKSPKKSKKILSFSKMPKLPSALRGEKQVEPERASLEPLEAWQETHTEAKRDAHPSDRTAEEEEEEEEEMNSVAVHTSVGASSGSEISLGGDEGEGGGGERLEVPMEQETLDDCVQRLQLSVQEHWPEQLQFAEKEKKKGFISSIFSSKNKSS